MYALKLKLVWYIKVLQILMALDLDDLMNSN